MATARGLYSKYGTIHGFCTTMNQESILHPPFVLHFNNQAFCYLDFPICGFVFFFLFALRWTKFIQKMILLKWKSALQRKLSLASLLLHFPVPWCNDIFMFWYIGALVYQCFHILMHWYIYVDILIHWYIDISIHAADYKLLIPAIQTLQWCQ